MQAMHTSVPHGMSSPKRLKDSDMYRFATVLKTRLALAAASTTVAMLAACGGGGGGGDPATAAATSGNNTATAQGSSTGSANGVSQSSGNGKNTVPVTYALSVTTKGSGGVTSLPAGISCASASTCSFDYAADAVVALTATPATDYIFSGWTGACSGTTACSVTLSSAQSVTATFVPAPAPAPVPAPVTYALSVTKQGSGTVGSAPTGVSCAATATSCSGSFTSGTAVTLTAAPSSGYTFSGWSGACAGTALTCAVNMTAAQNVTANFTATPPPPPVSYTLSVSKQGSGTVNSAPSGVSCTATATSCSGSFTSGTSVTLTAAASTGSTFAGWGGACAASGTASTCSVTMGSAQAVSANFTLNNYSLTVTNQGSGTVTSTASGSSTSCSSASCSTSYAYGSSVALSAAPASGYTFTSWGGACSGSGACTVTVSSAAGVTANYTANVAPAVTLIQDTRMLAIPNTGVYPTKGVAQTDPNTKFTVTRVADKSELVGDYVNHASPISAIVYSRYTPSNTTGEFVLVHGDNSTSAWIYRTSDNKMMTALKIKPTVADKSTVRSLGEVNELRWDYSGAHPYRLYFVGRSIPLAQAVAGEKPGMTFYYTDINPTTGAQSTPVVIRDFSSAFSNYTGTEIMNDVEGDSSNDSRYWAWQVMDTSITSGTYKPVAIFSYDMQTNTVMGSLQRSCTNAKVGCTAINTPATAAPYISRPNMVEMSPSGARTLVHWQRVYTGSYDADLGSVADGPKAFLPNYSDPIRIAADATHSGWAWGPNGEEMFVSQNNRNDWIEAVNIASSTTANCTLISGNSYSCGTKIYPYATLDGGSWTLGMHFGKVYNKAKKGWVFMNTYDKTNSVWAKNQNLFIEINPYGTRASKLVRFGASYNAYYDYRSEGSGALDFNGDNIWATGNWGFTDGRGDVFRITLPSGWFSLIK